MPSPVNNCMDVGFASSTLPANSGKEIAMAFGYADNDQDPNHINYVGRGQTCQRLAPGAQVLFRIFDTSLNSPASISSVTIIINNKDEDSTVQSPFDSDPPSNFYVPWPAGSNEYTTVQLQGTGQPTPSAGCNVTGRTWWVGPFKVYWNLGEWEITVKVQVRVNSQTLTFSVDPEMEVTQGGN